MKNTFYSEYQDGELDDDVRNLLLKLAENETIPLSQLTPAEVRKNSLIKGWIKIRSKVPRTNIVITGRNGSIPIRIYSPLEDGLFPVIIYFHGGGWVFGSLDEADHICSAFSNDVPAIVVSVDYRLSPENKFPAAIEDGYDVLLWVQKEIRNFNGNPARIGVAGESAGANIATVISQIARDKKEPSIIYQLLLCPVTDLSNLDTISYKLFGNGIWLSKKNMEYYINQYLKDKQQAKDTYASPLLAKDLRNLPPAHIITAEFDVLRDEGECYAKKLSNLGVVVTCKRYSGMIHVFFILNRIIRKADSAIDDCIQLLQNNLYRKIQ